MRHKLILVFALFTLLPTIAWAQSAITGSIAGVVRDTSGGVLPGVTVEASSPALIEKVRTAVTDEQGQYKIVELRPGTYTVTFSLPGFATLMREGIELTTGFTATANAEMHIGQVAETITVSGASPIVDIQNVREQKVLSREVLTVLPTARMTVGFAAVMLGASNGTGVAAGTIQDVGGNKGDQALGIAIHGSDGRDMRLKVDGMGFNNAWGQGGGTNRHYRFNEAAAQEIVLETGGISAESETGGIQLNVVPRDGGNTFRGYLNFDGTNGSLQGNNVSDELRARGVTAAPELKLAYDGAGGLGGYIRKDTLWFYTAARRADSQEYQVGTYYNKTQNTLFYTPDLDRRPATRQLSSDAGIRLTWQVSPKHKINFFHSQQASLNAGRASATVTVEAGTDLPQRPNSLSQVTWSYPASNRLLIEAGTSYLRADYIYSLQPEVTPNNISVLELSTGLRYGAPPSNRGNAPGTINKPNMGNQRFAVSYVTGSHAFKTGVTLQNGALTEDYLIHPVTYTFRNRLPVFLTQWAMRTVFEARLRPNLGLYAQDQWTIRRLTLNLGVRFDYLREYTPEFHFPGSEFVPPSDFPAVQDVPNWKDVGPRLGVAYDLFGNGRTAVKGYLGRYVMGEATSIGTANHPARAIVTSADRVWSDVNGNYVPDCDLHNLAANGECGAISNDKFGQPVRNTIYADDLLRGFGVRPSSWQASASFQHELRPGLGFDVSYFRTWFTNVTVTDNLLVTPADFDPYCITAPLNQKLPGGGGYQVCGLYDVTSAKFGQVFTEVARGSKFGGLEKIYDGVDVAVNARFGHGGMLAGGVSTGRTMTDNCALIDFQPQFCKNVSPFQPQIKFNGSYPLPWGVQVSGVFQSLPGVPIQASYVASNAEIQPSLGRNLAACGTRVPCTTTALVDLIEPNTIFDERLNQLDVRIAKIFPLGRARVQGKFDIYNMFNAASTLAVNPRYGSAWLTPTTILAARVFKFGAQVDF